MNRRTVRILGWLTAYALAAAASIALDRGIGPSSWCLPTVIGIGLLLRNGNRWWPAILAIELVASGLEYGGGPVLTLAIAASITGEELFGAWLVRRHPIPLESAEDVLGLAVLSTLVATLGASLVSVIGLPLGLAADPLAFWLAWWAGDLTALVTVLPLVLFAVYEDRDIPRFPRITGRALEAWAIVAASVAVVLLAVATAMFYPDYRGGFRFFWVLPALWAAVRFGRRLTAVSVTVTGLVAFVAPTIGDVQFDAIDRISVQGTLVAISLIGLAVAATLSGRRRAVEDLEHTLAALDASERRYTAVFEHSQAIQLLIDPETGAIVDANHAAARFYGWPREELRTMDVAALTAGNQSPAGPARPDPGDAEVHAVHRLANGETRDVALHVGSVVIGGRSVDHWLLYDISARIAAQAEVARLASVVESAAEAIVTTDLEGRITGWNAAATALYGYERAAVCGRDIADVLGPVALPFSELADLIQRRRSVRLSAVVRHATSGNELPVDLSIGPIIDGGTVVGMSRIAHDIRDRLREEERLRRRQALLADAAAIGRIGSWELDPETGETTWADELYRIAGIEPETAVGPDTLAELAHPDDRPAVEAALARREQRSPAIAFRLIGHDGIERAVVAAWSHVPGIRDGGREVGVLRDVTEEHQLEEQLRQSQRLESIGLLAGGIAHDFNNLLTAIGGFAELARAALAEGEPPDAELGQILAAVDRAGTLTAQLLAFGRRAIVKPRPVDLGEAVTGLVPILRRVLGERITILTELSEGVVGVIDPGQLDQVLVNLAVNARDAMPEGGRLRIAVGRADGIGTQAARAGGGAAGRAADQAAARDATAWIEVEDDGSGIPPDVVDRIFLPFFTTKQRGHGTGLGLSTVQGIVAQAGGSVQVQSRVGDGTTFRIELPAALGAQPVPPSPAPRSVASSGGGLVLLVEDEALVRRVGERVLERAGFTVMTAGNVPDALALAERECPDILVTDVVLPGVGNGIELAETLRARWPNLPVVITTGYTEQEPPSWATLLTKPFDLDALASVVRGLVQEAREATGAHG